MGLWGEFDERYGDDYCRKEDKKAISDLLKKGKSHSQIGIIFGVSRERIREIINHTFDGHQPKGKLSHQEVLAIRSRHQNGESMSALAKEYGVSKGTICKAFHGQTWASVAGG